MVVGAHETALAKIFIKEEPSFIGLDEIRLETLALCVNLDVTDRIVVLDESAPAADGRRHIRVGAKKSPANSEGKGEIIDNRDADSVK